MNWDNLLDHLSAWLHQRIQVRPGLRWVVGVSGGADSTLLLHALHALNERAGLRWSLHVAHFHHGLRGGEADEDEQFVAKLADRLGLPFYAERADIKAAVEKHGGSTEQVAREHRYEFLERTALRTGSGFVATAHHADDNAETLLHRICRGTGLRGLAGMAEVRAIQPGSRVQLVRPLLPIRRATIDALCQARNIEYRIDSSNALLDFTRNRLRYSIIPTLREAINPNVTEALLRIAEQVRWLGAYVDDAATRAFDSLLVNESPRHIVLNTTALLSKQRLIQAEVVRRAITQIAGREQDLNFAHIEQVLKLAEDLESGKEVHVPGPVVVRKLYERLEFRPLGDSGPLPAMETLSVQLPGRTSLAPLGLELESELMELRSDESEHMRLKTNPFEEWMDLDRLRPPLFVRSRREGDRFRPLGAPGAKTISDFLSDEKVDPLLRSRVGLLCDQEGPVWVMPLRIEDRVKIRPTTTRAVRFVLTAAGPYVPDGS